MILSDLSIKGYISTGDLVITPLDADDIQPASVDVHLADQLLIPQSGYLIDPRKRQFFDTYSLVHMDGYIDLSCRGVRVGNDRRTPGGSGLLGGSYRGEVIDWKAGPDDSQHCRICGPGLSWAADPRDQEQFAQFHPGL